MIRAVIFDLDDTLISEREYIKSGFYHVSKLLSTMNDKSASEIYQLLVELFKADPKNVFNRLLNQLGMQFSDSLITYLVGEYRNHTPTIKFYEDVIPCLEKLKKKSIKLGIITDGYANVQRKKLQAVNAYKYFDEIIVTDEYGREYWKPHPLSFQIMRERLDVFFEEIIYVGDNPEKDFYITSIYPLKTARIVRDGIYKGKEYKDDVRENFKLDTLNDLLLYI